jgi:hypothetical protein
MYRNSCNGPVFSYRSHTSGIVKQAAGASAFHPALRRDKKTNTTSTRPNSEATSGLIARIAAR